MVERSQSAKAVSERISVALGDREDKWLAQATNLSSSTIGDYLRKGVPTPVENIGKIAAALGVSADWLLTGAESGEARRGIDNSQQIAVPIYDVEVSAGGGEIADEAAEPIGQWVFDRNWLEANLRVTRGLRMFHVKGDSQEPDLYEGDLVLVDTGSRRLANGMHVVRLDDGLFLKNVHIDGASVRLMSRNQRHGDMVVPLSEANSRLTVIGRAVWASKML